jgi:hypothetical protein
VREESDPDGLAVKSQSQGDALARIKGFHLVVVAGNHDAESAMRKLSHAKFEGVVVDLAVDGSLDLLQKIGTLTSNRSVLTFAILPEQQIGSNRLALPASFVLERPLSPAVVFRMLKASYPMMIRERRRYFRYPLQISVFVCREGNEEFAVTSLNLS